MTVPAIIATTLLVTVGCIPALRETAGADLTADLTADPESQPVPEPVPRADVLSRPSGRRPPCRVAGPGSRAGHSPPAASIT